MLIKKRLTLKGSFFSALKSIVFILMFLVPKMHKLEVNLVISSKHFWCHFVNVQLYLARVIFALITISICHSSKIINKKALIPLQ